MISRYTLLFLLLSFLFFTPEDLVLAQQLKQGQKPTPDFSKHTIVESCKGDGFTYLFTDIAGHSLNLWRLDDNSSDPQFIRVIQSPHVGKYGYFFKCTLFQDHAFFFTGALGGNRRLWISNGSSVGTMILEAIRGKSNERQDFHLVPSGDALIALLQTRQGAKAWSIKPNMQIPLISVQPIP